MFFQSFQQTNLQHPSTFPNSDSLELFGRLFSVFGKSEIPLLLKIQQKNKKNSELNISIFFVLIFKMAVSKKGCVITERTVSPQHCLPQRGPISKKFLCKSALAQATGAEMAIGVSPPKPSLGNTISLIHMYIFLNTPKSQVQLCYFHKSIHTFCAKI